MTAPAALQKKMKEIMLELEVNKRGRCGRCRRERVQGGKEKKAEEKRRDDHACHL
jgi:hypothetical protein